MAARDVEKGMLDVGECIPLIQNSEEIIRSAVAAKDFERFRQSVEKGVSLNIIHDAQKKLTIFQYLCLTPGYREFIEEGIRSDPGLVNKDNGGKFPLHYAAESMDVDNMGALLETSTTQIDLNAKWDNKTALFILCDGISDGTYENASACIRYLIAKGANVNIPGRGGQITPILILLRSKKLQKRLQGEMAKYFVDNCPALDLDSFSKGKAREMLRQDFPEIVIPERPAQVEITPENLLANLPQEEVFVRNLRTFVASNASIETKRATMVRLLHQAAKDNRSECVRELIAQGVDVNGVIEGKSALFVACVWGCHEILDLLLPHPDLTLSDESFLSTVVKEMGAPSCRYWACFNRLMQSPKMTAEHINRKEAATGCTPLFYAVKYKQKEAIAQLLDHSAYIGTRNVFKDIAISEIPPDVLESYLDTCVTTNTKRPGDEFYEIIIDFKCLVPPSTRRPNVAAAAEGAPSGSEFNCEEMAPLEYMASTKELQHLLKHPVIMAFLYLKWNQLRSIFFLNFFLFSVYFVSLIAYIVFCYEANSMPALTTALWSLSVVTVALVSIRELIQMVLVSHLQYFKSVTNWAELILLALSWFLLCSTDLQGSVRRITASIIILLATAEFALLLGALPYFSISVYMAMLKRVAQNFLKGFALFSIYVVGFAFTFYALFRKDGAPEESGKGAGNTSSGEGDDDEESEFNKFQNPGSAIIKTLVMLTGEFDAADFDFRINAMTYLVFILFVFFISIILLNLLNGLAVNDTQEIQMKAELIDLIQRTRLLCKYEQIAVGKNSRLRFFARFISCCGIPMDIMSLFPDRIPNERVQISPNQSDLPLVASESRNSVNEKVGDQKANTKSTQRLKTKADGKLIKYLNIVIDRNTSEKPVDIESVNERLDNMERNMTQMRNEIKELLMSIKSQRQ